MRNRTISDILRDVNIAPQMQDTLARIVKNLGGGRPPLVFSNQQLGPIVNAVETVVCLTPPLNPGVDAATVLLIGTWATPAIGTTGSLASTSLRRGTTIAGTLLGFNQGSTVVAGNLYSGFNITMDTPGAVAGQQYVLSVSIGGATANTALGGAFLMAMAIG